MDDGTKAGIEFVQAQLPAWEQYVSNPVFDSGRFEERFETNSMSIHYGSNCTLLVQSFLDKSKATQRIETIYNSVYAATIAINHGRASLSSYSQLPSGKKSHPGRELNPVFYTSFLLREFNLVEELKKNNLIVTSFRQNRNATNTLTLTPNENLKGRFSATARIAEVELVFDGSTPIPVSLKYVTETTQQNQPHQFSTKISLADFQDRLGVMTPTRIEMEITQNNQTGKTTGVIECDPDEELNDNRCELDYYGLKANPVADFSRRRCPWIYVGILTVMIILGGGLWYIKK
jgi:hypothetical protein